jgi:transcriptional regulator with XRE-family HTH domain
MIQICLDLYLCIVYDAMALDYWNAQMQLTEVGRLLKEARLQTQVSQQELAAPLGMSRATISALEGGRCAEIGFTKLSALLDLVGLEITVTQRKQRPTLDDLRAERRR